MFDEGQATADAIPRPPPHLIAAPLQSTSPATGAALFRKNLAAR